MAPDAAQNTSEAIVLRDYFARWRLHSTRRWTAVHWFRDAMPACGLPEPDGPYDLDLPPEPTITCKRCQRLNAEQAAGATVSASQNASTTSACQPKE